MSQILEYFRSLFAPSTNNRGKRKRCEFPPEEPQYPIKYRRVSNIFPKTYSRPIDDDTDLFEQVKHRQPQYNELLESFLMDQNRKLSKNILEDGEFSDEDELNTYRKPTTQKPQKDPPYEFGAFYRNSQPSTSSAFLRQPEQRSSSSAFGDDNDIQFVSIARANPHKQKSTRNNMPPLVPIASSVASSSYNTLNGHHSPDESSRPVISAQPTRGRRSFLGLGSRHMAFNSSPAPVARNTVLNFQNNMEVRKQYDTLLKSLIPSFPSRLFSKKFKHPKELNQPITTIDLSNDVDVSSPRPQHQSQTSTFQNFSHKGATRKSDNIFKKPQGYIDLSDDEDQVASFTSNQILSSTILKSTDKRKTVNATQFNQSQTKGETTILPDIKPINSLQEKQASIKACNPEAINEIVRKFNESRELKDRVILEENEKVKKFENERIQHERDNQRRIDDSLLTALADKCIILDEEEEAVDEFPSLKEEHIRTVNYALHGPKQEIIVSKFKMDVSRYDFSTLEGLNWLNDMVINFYLELIKERSEQVDYLPKVHVMNTVFLGKLLEQGYSSVRRWTRRVDIFSYDIIPVPVHVGGVHWCMSIIHLKNKTIKYYDSMGHPNNTVLDALENYLMEESLDKKKVPFDFTGWSMECVRDCPQQRNGSDCGVFSCQFAEFVSRDSAISFEQQHMPYFRRKMIYEIASGKLMLGF